MPAPTYVPITPDVLGWAIEQAGLDAESVAARTDVDRGVIDQWVSGKGQPSKTQFKKLARLLRRPQAFFFLEAPPADEGVPPAFRHPPSGERESTREELEAVRRARRIQKISIWASERVDDVRWQRNPIPERQRRSPSEMAAAVREWLNWDTTEQQAASSASQVVKFIRTALEQRGVLALQLSIGKSGCRGFSLYDERKPVVAINTHYNPEARLFTYLHELGHLTTRADSMCVGYAETATERWCEAFAAAFLLPTEHLALRVELRTGGHTVRSIDQARRLARDFNVSLSAMAIRLDNLGWGNDLFARVPRDADLKSGGGGRGADNTRGAARLRELGEGYFGLLLSAQETGALRRQDVLRYLDVTEEQLDRIDHESDQPLRM